MLKKLIYLADMLQLNTGFSIISVDILPRLGENINMCKQISFVEAVEETVTAAVNRGQPFTIHDITSALRNCVNDDVLEFTGRSKEDVDGEDTYRVDHQEVRQVFQDLWRDGKVNASESWNGRCRVYTPIPTPTLPQKGSHLVTGMCPPTSMPKANLAAIGSRATATCCGVPSQSCVPLPSKSLADQLKAYFQTLADEGYGKVTIKQIQSRFKNLKGITCEQYADTLTSLGYAVDNSTPYPSKWTVVI